MEGNNSKESLFRKESLEKISSPEAMHDYMRVTNPRIWMLLSVITALLIGFLIYAAVTTLETTIPLKATVQQYEYDGESVSMVALQLSDAAASSAKPGMKVRVAGREGKISYIFQDQEETFADVELTENSNAAPLTPGTYDAELVTESASPMSYLFN